MDNWLLAFILKPFFALAFLSVCFAVRYAIAKFMPDSKFKRLLLLPLNRKQTARGR